jgi:eukaryotic-like serine/threonine-protein kinase
MNLERERLALQYLDEALTWHREEREWRLRVMLNRDPDMLVEVRALLAAADAANVSLPTVMPMGSMAQDAPPPERIGPYRVGELLGKGGMGQVYRAERVDGGFEQTIAIKLMRRSRVPAPLAEQFARERQILARLQHRNIAQLFDGGVTPDGQSYFVMELVTGRAITQYAQEERLALEDTLQLFAQVCSAVQYAHSHLIVHADIKPNNIIVTADGTAKLLDFGVARVLGDAAEEAAGSSGAVGITYDYASPARQRGEPATTVDDVYSLGMLLSELLQRFPHCAPDLRSIWLRARADDVDARYASVGELHADVKRWRDGLPVSAHSSSWSYITGKFLERYRLVVGIGGTALVLLVGAAVALAVLYVHAQQSRLKAEQRFSDLRSLSHYVLFDVYDRLETMPRALTLRRDIAEAGQSYLDRLSRDPEAPVEVRLEVAEGLRRLAQVQASPGAASLAEVPLARANLDRAEALARALPDDTANRRARSMLLARIGLARAILASEQDLDFTAARAKLREVSALVGAVLEAHPGDEEASRMRLDIAVEDAGTLEWQGHYTKAVKTARAALDWMVALKPASRDARRALGVRRARLLDIMAEGLYYSGAVPAAEGPYREEYELLRMLSADDPQDVAISRRVARAGWALGTTMVDDKRPEEGERILADAQALGERLLPLEPDDQELARMVNIITNAHAQALVALRRFSEARPMLEQVVSARRRRWEESPRDWSRARDYALAQSALAEMWADAGQARSACATYADSLATFERIRAAGKLAQLDVDYSLPNIYRRVTPLCPAVAHAFPASR